MPQRRRLCLAALAATLPLATRATTPETALDSVLENTQPVGAARLKVWGFDVYDAKLRADPGFSAAAFDRHRFALELAYLRTFKGADIAERSIGEMRGIEPLSAEQATRWQEAMARLFPDVQKGDRITGLHQPGQAARFYLNGRLLGDISDPGFSRRFFGIWLSPQTSLPRMREQLLGLAGRTP